MIKEDLSSITLIMPTYNRHYFAKRAISYWSDTNISLIVLDGSSSPFTVKEINDLPPNVEYIHSNMSLTERILLGSKMIETEFTALAFDDEFYMPETLALFARTLETDLEIVSLMGNVAGFTSSRSKYFYQHIYPEINGYEVDQQNSYSRVHHHLNPYRMTSLTALTRTEVFLKCAMVSNCCSKMPYTTMFELGFEIANSFLGRSRVEPWLYWFRSFENPPSWDSPKEKIWIWWENYRHSQQSSEICLQVENLLRGSDSTENFTPETSILYMALSEYCEGVRNHHQLLLKKNKSSKLRKIISIFLHDDQVYSAKNFMKKFLGKKRVRAFWIPISELLETLATLGINTPQASARKLIAFLEKYPKKDS